MREAEGRIDAIFAAYAAAVLARDADAFLALYADDVRVFDLWDRWAYDGAPAWRQAVEQWFATLDAGSLLVRFHDMRIAAADSLAVASAFVTYTNRTAAGDIARSMSNRLTWGLAQRGGAWLIAHEHSSAPIRSADLKAELQWEPEGPTPGP